MSDKIITISGITGQDSSYLADFHLAQGDTVIGLKRRSSTDNEWRLEKAKQNPNFKIRECDLVDSHAISGVVAEYQPDIFYNMAAQSHVGTSFDNPSTTLQVNTVGVINCLEAIKNISPHTRFVQASTSEMFGRNYEFNSTGEKVQNENTKFVPQSPYAVSKLAAHDLCRIYRDGYGLFISTAISFNHGGPRRGDNFIEMKVGKWIKDHRDVLSDPNLYFRTTGFDSQTRGYNKLHLGNLDSYRDFTDARDIVRGLIKIGQYERPDDFVLCSGKSIQIRDLVDKMFRVVGISCWGNFVYIDPDLFRPAEVDYLRGDASKAYRLLGWKPEITLDQMVWDIINES